MRWGLLAALGLLAVVAGTLAAWLASPATEPWRLAVPEPVFLREAVAVRDLTGERQELRAPEGGALVIAFFVSDCPTAAVSLPSLAELVTRSPANSLRIVGVCVDPEETDDAIAHRVRELGLTFPIARDRRGVLSRLFGAMIVPEAFVLDDEARLRYRGWLDGQALREAIAATTDGRRPPPVHTDPRGQPLPRTTVAEGPPTFHHDIAPILRRSCRFCHQAGRSGPFPLVTYTQAAKRANDLAEIVASRRMPPWKPVPGTGVPLKHDRTLLDSEIEVIRAWAEAGVPEGPSVDAPEETSTSGDWVLGTPDLVLEMDEPFEVPATGVDVYRCFVMPTNLPAERSLAAIEVLPGNPRVVHHTFSYVDNRGLGRERDAADQKPGYMCFSGFTGDRIFGLLGGWTPGNEPHPFGEGIGLEVPAGVDVVMQVHYHPSGKPETDRTRLGLHLSKSPIRQALEWVSACADPATFVIPAGEPDHRIGTMLEVPFAVELHAMTPHMHMLGRRFRASVRFPEGRTRTLIEIDDWDFNRQDTYYLREPLTLPAGSIVQIEGWFDNSSANPRNPSQPPRDVLWGEATTDDMLILFLALTESGQDLTRPDARNDFMSRFFRTDDETEEKSLLPDR